MKKFSKLLNPCRKQLSFFEYRKATFWALWVEKGCWHLAGERRGHTAGDPSSGALWNFSDKMLKREVARGCWRTDFGTGLQGTVQMVSKKSLLSVFVKCLLVSDTLPDAGGTAGVRQTLLLLPRFIATPPPQQGG